MADSKISALAAVTTVGDTDEYVTAVAGATKKITGANLKAAVAPVAATYITQTASSGLSAEQAMGALATGLVKNTTTSGVQSIAALGTDYYGPTGTDVAVADGGTGASTAAAALANLGVSHVLLASSTLGSPAANFDLTSISGAYNHLEVMYVGQTSNAANQVVGMTFNNDTAGNYDWERTLANGTTASANEGFAQTSFYVGIIPPSTSTSMPGSGVIRIPFYTGTTFHKSARSFTGHKDGASTGLVEIRDTWGSWRNTAAITRITLTPAAGNWVTGSAYTLYGIL